MCWDPTETGKEKTHMFATTNTRNPRVDEMPLGDIEHVTDLESSVGSLKRLRKYKVSYPPVVAQALGQLYMEYNEAFQPIVAANREWPADYQYCMGPQGIPVNHLVQIDMNGLTRPLLDAMAELPVDEVRETLRHAIFEIENSLAMYQIMERSFAYCGDTSAFSIMFRSSLRHIRATHNKPIALLAVTDEKYSSMAAFEFGVARGRVSNELVHRLSGFDSLFSPAEFREHVEQHNGECKHLLYVRSSDPIAKLKRPSVVVRNSLLTDPLLRRIIKANSVTLNIDAPEMTSFQRINDTKAYMAPMHMGFEITCEDDLLSPAFGDHLKSGQHFDTFAAPRLSEAFTAYLQTRGVDPWAVETGQVLLRFKPAQGVYGCYGHHRGSLASMKLRRKLRRELKGRGKYIVQTEIDVPTIVNTTSGAMYNYIDRNIMAIVNGRPEFLGGFRTMMPTDSEEAMRGRIHGNASTVWAEILPF